MFTLMLIAAATALEPVRAEFVPEPAWPASAVERGEPAEVGLLLTVAPDGKVRRVEVVRSAGEALDRAASDAARGIRFAPQEEAGWLEIEWTTRFEPELAPALSVEGVVRVAGTREAGVGLRIVAERDGERRFATGDADGAFRFAGLAAGPWRIAIDEPGYEPLEADVEVKDGVVSTVAFTPKVVRPWEVGSDDFDEEIVVVQKPVAVEVSERALSRDEIRYLPGSGGDVVKAVQNLPGIGRPAFGIGQLLIRGTAPEDSAYYLDGARLPAVFHFAGLSTVINGDILEEVALLSGNYSARYGRTLGGVVDLRTSDRLPERSGGYASVDLFQAAAFVEQRIDERTSLTVSGRRSYIDAVLTPVLSSLGSSTVRAPRYYDLQVRALHHTRDGVVDAMFFLSDDAFRVVGDQDDADEVQIGLTERFQKLNVRWTHDLGAGWKGSMSFLIGPESRGFAIAPDGRAREKTTALNQRVELTRGYQGGAVAWRTGVDLYTGSFAFDYDVPSFGAREVGSVWFTSPSPYVEPSFRTGPIELTAGLRVDPWILDSGYTAVAVDPRGVARVNAGQRTVFEAAVGRFSQFPGPRQVLSSQGGNPGLGPQSAIQAAIGVEQDLGRVNVELTAFGSLLSELVVGREDAFRFFTGPPPVGPLDTGAYENEGTGRIGGVEALVRYDRPRTTAWLSATVSRSTRVKREDEKERLFEYDQPLLLNAIGMHQLGRGWRIGTRLRYGSGNPYTPVANRVYDLDRREFQPVFGAPDSGRLPAFFSADLRIDKDFVYRYWKLTTYLDLQNATNRRNVDVIGWTDDFSREEPIAGLPLVPAFGVRGEW